MWEKEPLVEYRNRTTVNQDCFVYQRPGSKKGTWHYCLTIRGAYIRKSTGETDQRRAWNVAMLAYQEACHRVDVGLKPVVMTVADICKMAQAQWATELLTVSDQKRQTLKTRHYDDGNKIKNHIIPKIGDRPIDKLDETEIEEFIELLRLDGLKASSRNNVITTLSRVMLFARRKRYLSVKPTIKRANVQDDIKDRGAFTGEQIAKILDYFWHKRHRGCKNEKMTSELYYYCMLLAITGLRPSSVDKLKVGDITPLPQRHFRIKATTLKGGRRERHITPDLSFNHGQSGEFLYFLDDRKPEEKLFTYTKGAYADGIMKALNKLNEQNQTTTFTETYDGLRLSTYSFRHYYITHALIKGVPLTTIAWNTLTSVHMITSYYDKIPDEHKVKILRHIGGVPDGRFGYSETEWAEINATTEPVEDGEAPIDMTEAEFADCYDLEES